MSGRRETITLSLGPTANAVTSHLLNLEGLAVTTATADDGRPSCDPTVTHRRDSTNQVWVPRVLLVDESHRLQPQRRSNSNNNVATATAEETERTALQAAASNWTGGFQEVNMATFSLDEFCILPEDMVPNFSMNSNVAVANHQPPQEQPAWLSSWQQTANQLAYAPYSQYRVSQQQQHQQYSSSQVTQSESNARHFNWDDMGEEPDEDEEESAALRERQRREQERQWDSERQQYEDQLSTLWNPTGKIDSGDRDSNNQEPTTIGESSVPTEADLSNLSWMDYWMPPHPSPFSQCTFGLPSSSVVSSTEAPPIHAFNIASSGISYSKLILEDYWEKIRLELERMDACQGFTILAGGTGIYAGMTDWALQEMQQECRAASRWVFHVAEDDSDQNKFLPGNQENASPQRQSTELSMAQERLRNNVQRGLTLAGLSVHAHVTVPLMLPSSRQAENNSLFRASSELAMALETVTLPFRAQSSSKSTLVGWNSMSGYEEGASPSGMSMSDYINTLQPSQRYSLLELDSVLTSENRSRLGTSLIAGTSVERDHRMRQSRNSAAGSADYPGAWLLDDNYGASPNSPSPGVLTSLSPGHVATQDRSLHYHYGLSSCLRRSQSSGSPLLNDDNQQYLTCMMEGMGVRYRPETAFGLTTSQSLSQLTSSNRRQGAGSYWQYLMGATSLDIPVLSVLGNTTRMYPYLQSVASDMKTALKSSKTKGYYQREVASGTLPEIDDCEESLEHCLDLRDVYEPPNGYGQDDEAENYLDI